VAAFGGSDGSRLVKLINFYSSVFLSPSVRLAGIANPVCLIWNNEVPTSVLPFDTSLFQIKQDIARFAMAADPHVGASARFCEGMQLPFF
jgi:hypothetical protein